MIESATIDLMQASTGFSQFKIRMILLATEPIQFDPLHHWCAGMENALPDIFDFIDYRIFLDSYYTQRKKVDKSFTHVAICRHLGQENAKSYFNNVVKGRVNLSTTFIDRFISLLELSVPQAKYFRALVNYNQATSTHEKDFFFDQLIRLNKTPCFTLTKDAYAFYRKWYHSAIRALLDIMDIKDEYELLSRALIPSISEKEAAESMRLLNRLDLIRKNDLGVWKPTEKMIGTGTLAKDAVVRKYQSTCLQLARIALANEAVLEKRNITMTVSISETARAEVMEKIAQWKTELRSIIQKDDRPPANVYHLNLNFFPMSSRDI